MARSTRRTIRNTPTPLARDLLRFANNADTLSRRAKVLDAEKDAGALRALLATSEEHIEHLRALSDGEEQDNEAEREGRIPQWYDNKRRS